MNELGALSLAFAAATDIGCKRANNEDSFGYDNAPHLYVVCDGVGGGDAGEVASSTAVRILIESFEAQSSAGTPGLPVESRLLHSIREANRVVREIAENNPQFQNMGTTLVCACLDGARMLIGNVGDSRAYLIRDGVGVQITQDHSLLEEQVRGGIITAEMAATSNLQSVITRAIGAAETVEPDFFAADLQPDDLLLLATDGLTRYLRQEEIAAIASAPVDLPAICQNLVELAKQRGGADNITCIVLRALEALPAS
ncbi:MAG TPA: Stp1/IreP family PP2C-type Ser/Thr phosphatase [Acidobacteriaceae bacterium]|nr:Stp1/IreP family PP2C-type Ser/Thr phosphatase [Acidobacteriaceae bacterium]